MSGLYKLESYDEVSARKVLDYINKQGGKCIMLGYAVLTNYAFKSESCLDLVPYISSITDHLSEVDKHFWKQLSEKAA